MHLALREALQTLDERTAADAHPHARAHAQRHKYRERKKVPNARRHTQARTRTQKAPQARPRRLTGAVQRSILNQQHSNKWARGGARQVVETWRELRRLPELNKAYVTDILQLLGKTLEPWQADALRMCWHMVEKAADMRLPAFWQQAKLASTERSTQCSQMRKRRGEPPPHHPFHMHAVSS